MVTTGPDGAPMDEASQQSTLSNASAASGEDSNPKARKDGMGMYHNHPAGTPAGSSPGPSGMNSMHEDYEMSGPNNWPRTPASPVSPTAMFLPPIPGLLCSHHICPVRLESYCAERSCCSYPSYGMPSLH